MSNLSEISRATQSALPDAWIAKLFDRFATMYGRLWADTWAGIPMDEVRRTWAEDLAPFDGYVLRKALDHCKANNKFPPSCPEFVGLCRAFKPNPHSHLSALPAPRGSEIDPRVRAEIAKFLQTGRKANPKDWARQILKEANEGSYRDMHGIKCAKEALGIVPELAA